MATVAIDFPPDQLEEMMSKFTVSITPHNNQGRPHLKWVVNINHPVAGRIREFAKTKEEAAAKADEKRTEIRNLGIRALQLSDDQKLEALTCLSKLKPFGARLADATNFYVEHRQASTCTVSEVVEAYMTSRRRLKRKPRTLTNLDRFFDRFAANHGQAVITAVTTHDIEAWLEAQKVGAVSSNTYRTLLFSLWSWAVEKNYCRINPVAAIDVMPEKKEKVGILTVDQAGNLLKVAATDPENSDVLTAVAIGLFAGLRPESEIARLSWSQVELWEKPEGGACGLIDVSAENKTSQQRYVKILPVLQSWMDPIFKANPSGPVQGPNFRRRFDAVRRAAGFSVRGNGLPFTEEEKKTLSEWPHDAFRHSFASYHLAFFENAPALQLELGHQSTKLIFSNYRQRVRKSIAETFFKLTRQFVLEEK